MLKERYLEKVKNIVQGLKPSKDWQVFLFGSSVIKERFGDLDLGIMGKVSDKDISDLKDRFYDSLLPYNVDIVNFNLVSDEFKNNVLNNQIIWIKR